METLGDSPHGNLYDEMWESSVVHLCYYVPIMRMTSVSDAVYYIQQAWDEATPEEREQLNAAVLGKVPVNSVWNDETDDPWKLRASSASAEEHKGGADIHPMSIHDTDPRYAKLMELVDAIHDFGNEYPPNKRDKQKKIIPETDEAKEKRIKSNVQMRIALVESVKAIIPTDLKLKSVYHPCRDLQFLKERDPKYVVTPENRVLELIADKHAVSRMLTDCDALTFDGVAVPNPLKGRYLESTQKTRKGTHLVECKDIYFDAEPKQKKIAVVQDILDLRRRMEMFYTTRRESRDLQNMSLNIMIDQCMTIKYNREPSALFSWMTGLDVMTQGLNEFFALRTGHLIVGDEIVGACTFRSYYCDVSAYDNEDPIELRLDDVHSPVATGDVFHEKSEVQVSFGNPALLNKYTYTIDTADPDFNPIPWTDYGVNRDTIVVNNKVIERSRGRTNEDNSAKSMRRMIKRLQLENRDNKGTAYETNYHFAVPAAIKRAGDWGQIEHCKKKHLIFVTSDKATALYAAYRDVPVFFVKHDDHSKNGQVRFSFVMCGSIATRRACCWDAQTAGGRRNVIFNCVLFAITLVASFL
jgi:hypothetical protein